MIEVKALSFSYGSGGPKILKSLSCDLEQGHCIAVLGNNGAGKSTLLKCISRISHPQEGEVLADGGNIYAMPRRELAKKMAYVPQQSLHPVGRGGRGQGDRHRDHGKAGASALCGQISQ